jgi:hypothetical protein
MIYVLVFCTSDSYYCLFFHALRVPMLFGVATACAYHYRVKQMCVEKTSLDFLVIIQMEKPLNLFHA